MVTTRRVATWLINHDYDSVALVVEILCALEAYGRWLDSCVLANSEIADEYGISLSGEDWYVKFCLDEERVVVNVWSCWWQGAAH